MWIPHTIPKSTLRLFAPRWPDATSRAVDSEDFRWADRSPKPLRLLCLDVVGDHFTRFPPGLFDRIAPINAAYLAETLGTDLPIASVVHVPDGEYWRRRAADRSGSSSSSDGDKKVVVERSLRAGAKFWLSRPQTASPKTRFLNAFVSETVEDLEPGYVDETELAALLDACGPLVTVLECRRLRVPGRKLADFGEPPRAAGVDPKHVDLEFVLRRLDNVTGVSLVYGAKRTTADADHRREMDPFRFHADDMDVLGRGLVSAERLAALAITRSDLTAAKFRRLLLYLEQCRGLEAIDFSHCRLKSSGARAVARYAETAEKLKSVNLCGNDVGPDGVRSLAYALRRRNGACPAIELNLNMNDVNDLGAKYLASALASGVQPFAKLQIRDCNITEIGAMHVVKALAYDRGLSALEMDNNWLNMEVAVELHAVMKTNSNIAELSVMNCNFSEKMTDFLRNVAFHNRHGKRSELNYVDAEHLHDRVDDETVFEDDLSIESEIAEEDDTV